MPSPPASRLRVRYHPRRVRWRSARVAFTPGQALHLADDPGHAQRARSTAEPHELGPVAPTPPRVRRLHAWLHARLVRLARRRGR